MIQKEAIKSKIWVILQEGLPGFSANIMALKKREVYESIVGNL